jgi:hypothetical protein
MSNDADPLPSYLPVNSPTFPEELFEDGAGCRIDTYTFDSHGAVTICTEDGREGTYCRSVSPFHRGWHLQ